VELLKETDEAVAYLERHGELTLAAELAEARKLAPDLVVRHWMIAGDRARAIAYARLHDAFAGAVQRLEASGAKEATALRLLWADVLASSGAYAAAVDAAWPVEAARGRALLWLDAAIAVGGVVGARMLARKASLVPDAY